MTKAGEGNPSPSARRVASHLSPKKGADIAAGPGSLASSLAARGASPRPSGRFLAVEDASRCDALAAGAFASRCSSHRAGQAGAAKPGATLASISTFARFRRAAMAGDCFILEAGQRVGPVRRLDWLSGSGSFRLAVPKADQHSVRCGGVRGDDTCSVSIRCRRAASPK